MECTLYTKVNSPLNVRIKVRAWHWHVILGINSNKWLHTKIINYEGVALSHGLWPDNLLKRIRYSGVDWAMKKVRSGDLSIRMGEHLHSVGFPSSMHESERVASYILFLEFWDKIPCSLRKIMFSEAKELWCLDKGNLMGLFHIY